MGLYIVILMLTAALINSSKRFQKFSNGNFMSKILKEKLPIYVVYVDISQTTHLPHIDKYRHLTDHTHTSSCLRSN